MHCPTRWITVGAVGLLLLTGCSAGNDSASDEAVTDTAAGSGETDLSGEAPADTGEAAADASGGDGTTDTSEASGLSLATSDREVITSGSVTMTVADPEDVAAQLSRQVEGLGGWVEELSQQAASDYTEASAHLVVRIPSTDVTSTLASLEEYGTVEDVTLNRTDVTMQVRDVEARIRALRLSIERMEDLLARATSTEDLVDAEQMLTDRQSQLESLLSQQAQLADQVAMSTLEIQLWAPDALPEPEPESPKGFWGGLVTGWEAFLTFGERALLVLGVLLPWIAFFAVIAAIILVIARTAQRRRAAKGLPAASPRPSGPTTALRAPAGAAPPAGPGPGAAPPAGPATPQSPAGYSGSPPSGYPAGPQPWATPSSAAPGAGATPTDTTPPAPAGATAPSASETAPADAADDTASAPPSESAPPSDRPVAKPNDL